MASEHLCSVLNSHPSIICHREIFNNKELVCELPRDFIEAWSRKRYEETDNFLVAMLENSIALKPSIQAEGWKHFADHHQNGIEYAVRNQFLFIVLRRQCLPNAYISEKQAELSGLWNQHKGDTEYVPIDMKVEFEDFSAWAARLLSNWNRVQVMISGCQQLLCWSEDVDASLPDICSFLQVDPQLVTSAHSSRERQIRSPYHEFVHNYHELIDFAKKRGLMTWAQK
jgi:hypothetical protein